MFLGRMLECLKIITIFLYLDLHTLNWHTTEWNGGVKIKQKDGGFVVALKPGAHINAVQTDRPAVRVGDILTVIQKAGNLNIVFGGGNSFSHGVSVQGGKIRITIVNVMIQKP